MGPDRPVAAFAVLVIVNYFSVMSSVNVFSFKMSFYSVLRFEVNQGHYESGLMTQRSGTHRYQPVSRYRFAVSFTEAGEAETFTRFT